MEQILLKNSDSYLDSIKKLAKPEMNVSKECAVILIGSAIKKVPHLEASLLDIYKSIVFSENPSIRIIAAKYLRKIAENAANKE